MLDKIIILFLLIGSFLYRINIYAGGILILIAFIMSLFVFRRSFKISNNIINISIILSILVILNVNNSFKFNFSLILIPIFEIIKYHLGNKNKYVISLIILICEFLILKSYLLILLFILMILIDTYNSLKYVIYFSLLYTLYYLLGFNIYHIIAFLIIYIIVLFKNFNNLKINSYFNYIYIIIFILFISSFFKYSINTVLSDSMKPLISKGDLIIIKKDNNYKKGDIIYFNYDNKMIIHRLYEVKNLYDDSFYITKGDNNKTRDPFKISKSKVKGKVIYNIKYLGLASYYIYKIRNNI